MTRPKHSVKRPTPRSAHSSEDHPEYQTDYQTEHHASHWPPTPKTVRAPAGAIRFARAPHGRSAPESPPGSRVARAAAHAGSTPHHRPPRAAQVARRAARPSAAARAAHQSRRSAGPPDRSSRARRCRPLRRLAQAAGRGASTVRPTTRQIAHRPVPTRPVPPPLVPTRLAPRIARPSMPGATRLAQAADCHRASAVGRGKGVTIPPAAAAHLGHASCRAKNRRSPAWRARSAPQPAGRCRPSRQAATGHARPLTDKAGGRAGSHRGPVGP